MAKLKNKFDNNCAYSLFDLIQEQEQQSHDHHPAPGRLCIDRPFREAISAALKACPLSRYQVAARMSESCDTDITKTMLDSWTAESKEQHRFPAVFLPAFCEAVGSSDPLRLLGRQIGAFVLPGSEALRAEIRRLEEEIGQKQAEKRRRTIFLKELEAPR